MEYYDLRQLKGMFIVYIFKLESQKNLTLGLVKL